MADTATQRPAPLWFKAATALVGGWRDQAFLDRSWVEPLLAHAPPRRREWLALQLLALSPHYFVYQWTTAYPADATRSQILRGERRRLQESREFLAQALLLPHLDADDVVLDLGCGPGFLTHALGKHCKQVIGVDVSRGALACADLINSGSNVEYLLSHGDGFPAVGDMSVDMVCCFAVFQHLRRDQSADLLAEICRVLRPNGVAILHFAVGDSTKAKAPTGLRERYRLRFDYYSEGEIRDLVADAGLVIDVFSATHELAPNAPDDIGRQHTIIARRINER